MSLTIDNIALYPLKFNPILKSVIWGGVRIPKFKQIDANQPNVGECWEVSEVPQSVSVVSTGPLKGLSLSQLIAKYSDRLLGSRTSDKFPLLIKLIDARESLSIQVHPNDEVAQARHQSAGKTEMWYVIDAEPEAYLYSGVSRTVSEEEFLHRTENGTITEILQKHQVKAGDVFFLPAGRIHAIGKGIFLAEIQQNSDITYRIYDFERVDADGKSRVLHNDLAKDVVDLKFRTDLKVDYSLYDNLPIQLSRCEYFTTNILRVTTEVHRDLLTEDSFVVYICVSGSAVLRDCNDNIEYLTSGVTVLIPAELAKVDIVANSECVVLESYIAM